VKNNRFAAIILAGGLSTRMKEFKPLLALGDSTIAQHIISTFVSAGVDVLVVVGYRKNDIESRLKNEKVTIIDNTDYEKGMFTSVQAGIRGVNAEHRAFFILPADIPLVSPATIKKLAAAGIKNPGKIIYPVYHAERGHPPLVPALLAPIILAEQQSSNLKSVMKAHEDIALDLPVDDRFILFDVDTPEDYQELVKQYRHF
jgi:molybdenum cofactor cytidylyltransferase